MSARILLLSADFGSGHLSAATAIAAACRELDPTCEPEPVQVRSLLLDLVAWGYLKLIAWTPSLYRKLYHMPVGGGLRGLVRLAMIRTVRNEIARINPSVIVGTHPFPAGVAAWLRQQGRVSTPVVMALTDFLPHGLWIHEGVSRYCVSSETAADQLVQAGVQRDRVVVTGVAIHAGFGAVAAAPAETNPLRRVLVMGGGLGLGPIVHAVRSLAALPHPALRVTVICGTNRSLQQELHELFRADPRIEIIGFTTEVAAHMRRSALLVTKPGGITCSEAMAVGLPMLLLDPLPGHEEENAQYLVSTGSAMITDQDRVGRLAEELLFTQPHELRQMQQKAKASGCPHSARAIAREALAVASPAPHHEADGRSHTFRP